MTCRVFIKYITAFYIVITLPSCQNYTEDNNNNNNIVLADGLKLNLGEDWIVIKQNEKIQKSKYNWEETRLYLNQSLSNKFSLTFRVIESNNYTKKKKHENWFVSNTPEMAICSTLNENTVCETSDIQVFSQEKELQRFFQKDWFIPYQNVEIHIKAGAFTKADFENGLELSERLIKNLILKMNI